MMRCGAEMRGIWRVVVLCYCVAVLSSSVLSEVSVALASKDKEQTASIEFGSKFQLGNTAVEQDIQNSDKLIAHSFALRRTGNHRTASVIYQCC